MYYSIARVRNHLGRLKAELSSYVLLTKITETTTFFVNISGSPTSPHIKREESLAISATSIKVSWSEPDDEGAGRINEYLVYYEKGASGDIKKIEVPSKKRSEEIKGLMENQEYVIWVVAKNEHGNSEEKQNSVKIFTLAPSKSSHNKTHSTFRSYLNNSPQPIDLLPKR